MNDGAAAIQARQATADRRHLVLLFVLLLGLAPGCTEDVAHARARGFKVGYEEGYRDGEAEGYERRFRESFGTSFDRWADDAPKQSEIPRDPVRLVVFVLVFLLLGFGAQYSALYLLRRAHILRDVDSILLGGKNASLTIKSLDPEQAMSTLLDEDPEEQRPDDE